MRKNKKDKWQRSRFGKVDATFPLVYGGFTMLGNLKIEFFKEGWGGAMLKI